MTLYYSNYFRDSASEFGVSFDSSVLFFQLFGGYQFRWLLVWIQSFPELGFFLLKLISSNSGFNAYGYSEQK